MVAKCNIHFFLKNFKFKESIYRIFWLKNQDRNIFSKVSWIIYLVCPEKQVSASDSSQYTLERESGLVTACAWSAAAVLTVSHADLHALAGTVSCHLSSGNNRYNCVLPCSDTHSISLNFLECYTVFDR